ncbi:MAG TPA: BatA and WFA domain-containing protein [Planctomycetota bacterium]|nr:BatA and WFA domain-containing protein [Planctomycetota bacterium]
MTSLGFHALSSAVLFGLIVPLVLFYFLKLKRPRLEVPSLYLWRQVVNDSRVNSPFQRFKRNLLLLLQLLILIALVLAAMQPYWRGRESRMQRLPVLVDCSASMAALDKAGGTSRLDEAKARVRKLIDEMLPDQELCLVAFSRTARRCTSFTNDKRLLRAALDAVQVEDVSSDVEAPLRLAQALGRSASFDEVLLLTDGNLPARADFELSFKIDYQRLPAAGPNIGLTAFNATRSSGGDWLVFVGIEGSPDADLAATLELTVQDVGGASAPRVLGSERIIVTKGRAERVTFRVSGDKAVSLTAKLAPDGFDSLASDNVAYLDLPRSRPLWVYAAPSLASWRHALAAMPTVRLFPEEGTTASETSYDLVITDREDDLALGARTLLTVGLVPAELSALVAIDQQGTQVVDWRRNATLLQHVELSDLILLDRPVSKEGVRALDYEALGYEILADGQRGPLILEKRRGQDVLGHLLFHSDRSTLPYRIGFPILVSNLVQAAMDQAGLAKAQGARTGVLPPIALKPERGYVVEGPDGDTREEKSDKQGLLGGIPAPRVGSYRVAEGGTEAARIGASLLSPTETQLAGVEAIEFNEKLTVAASAEPRRADKPFWWTLALVAFGVLLGEWWLFQRRPGGFAR